MAFNVHKINLADLQANILKPHAKESVICLFLSFDENKKEQNCQWINQFATNQIFAEADVKSTDLEKINIKSLKLNEPGFESLNARITNAKLQQLYYLIYDNERGKKGPKVSDNFSVNSFYLTASGYSKLGVPKKFWPKDESFRQGMKNYFPQRNLQDNLENWDDPYYGEDEQFCIDSMILLANNNKAILNEQVKALETEWKKIGAGIEIVTTEEGSLRGDKGNRTEAFGYRDGLSQPVFWEDDKKTLIPKNLNLVLVEEEGLGNEAGSYFVFRKLWQDVAKFNRKIGDLKGKLKKSYGLGLSDEEAEQLAKAQVMGRYPDGTPLVLKNKLDSLKSELEEAEALELSSNVSKEKSEKLKEKIKKTIKAFDHYNPDPDAANDHQNNVYERDEAKELVCPFHAHTRKVNPRVNDSKVRFEKYDGHPKGEIEARIVRRGIPYGEAESGDEGMLFMCYQASIKHQFEKINRWSNQSSFPNRKKAGGKLVGIDPISGQNKDNKKLNFYGKDDEIIKFNFHDVVKSVGGEYFFAPSIPFLQNLKYNKEKTPLI